MFLPYGRQWIAPEDRREIDKVLSGDWLTQGPRVEEFEALVAAYAGISHAIAFSNGTAALHGAMYAAGVWTGGMDCNLSSYLRFHCQWSAFYRRRCGFRRYRPGNPLP